MSKSTESMFANPQADQVDIEVVQFREQFDSEQPSVLDQVVRDGARKMLQAAL